MLGAKEGLIKMTINRNSFVGYCARRALLPLAVCVIGLGYLDGQASPLDYSPFVGIKKLFNQTDASEKVVTYLKKQSPDDLTKEQAEELKQIAQKAIEDDKYVSEESRRLLIWAFTFGVENMLEKDIETAFGLFPDFEAEELKRVHPDILFCLANISYEWYVAMLISGEASAEASEALSRAQESLDIAAEAGSPDAEFTKCIGGFMDFGNMVSKGNLELMEDWNRFWRWTGVATPKMDEQHLKGTIVTLLLKAQFCDVCDEREMLRKYNYIRTASLLEKRDTILKYEIDARVHLLLGRQGGTFLASPKVKDMRKFIVCTDNVCKFFQNKDKTTTLKRTLDTCQFIADPSKDCLFIPETDIRRYNEKILEIYPKDKSKTLVFKAGHPRNGYTYVQHPYRQNEYIELSEFHWAMLYEKFNEMSKVFEMLGAKEVTCKVTDTQASREVTDERLTAHVEATYKKVGGGIGGSCSERVGETSSRLRSLELNRKSKGHKPRRPAEKEVPFLRDSKELQRLVNDVCGGLAPEKEDFTLVYKDDYGVNAKTEASLEVEVKSGVVDGKVQGGWEMTSDLAVNKSLLWVYTVKFK